jgi:8-oxo-dGTP pyrophosphatase MutT (NUDIX family)
VTLGLRIWDADRLDCRVVEHRWPFDADESGAIAEHWAERTRVNPSLYDGVVLLARRADAKVDDTGDRVLDVEFFEARFSRFLAWRDFGWVDESVFNVFAMPALRTSDGAFLLGEMAPGHSYAGRIYFPCGTPDREDVVGDAVDLDGSLVRELAEEAGIAVAREDLAPSWRIVFAGQQVACMKIIDWPETAAEVRSRAEAFIASEPTPELSGVHLISRRAELADPRISAFVAGFLESLLAD